MLDRFLHGAGIVVHNGKSYRMLDRQQRRRRSSANLTAATQTDITIITLLAGRF